MGCCLDHNSYQETHEISQVNNPELNGFQDPEIDNIRNDISSYKFTDIILETSKDGDEDILKLQDENILKLQDENILKLQDENILKLQDENILKLQDENILKLQ